MSLICMDFNSTGVLCFTIIIIKTIYIDTNCTNSHICEPCLMYYMSLLENAVFLTNI